MHIEIIELCERGTFLCFHKWHTYLFSYKFLKQHYIIWMKMMKQNFHLYVTSSPKQYEVIENMIMVFNGQMWHFIIHPVLLMIILHRYRLSPHSSPPFAHQWVCTGKDIHSYDDTGNAHQVINSPLFPVYWLAFASLQGFRMTVYRYYRHVLHKESPTFPAWYMGKGREINPALYIHEVNK